MRSLLYSIRMLVLYKRLNLIKFISLTFGLFIGIILFARVAFELSFDTHYKESDRLFSIYCDYTIGGKKGTPVPVVYSPLPAAMMEKFPDEIESATVIFNWGKCNIYEGNRRFENLGLIFADTLFFHTMGLDLLKGDARDLNTLNAVFISASLAKQLYGDNDPVGKVLDMNKNMHSVVKGVFRDIPENSSFRYDLIGAFIGVRAELGREGGWKGDDSYRGYVRFRHAGDAERVESRLPEFTKSYLGEYDESIGLFHEYLFRSVTGIYKSNKDVKRMTGIMSLLGVIILLVAALNYILISLSSMPARVRMIGIYKCNGASGLDIFNLFMLEAAILLLISVACMILIMVNLRGVIEDMIGVSLTSLFTWNTLWLPLLMVFLLFLAVAVFPAILFSRIPVNQVFRRHKENKRSWKRPLLFVQVTSVCFVFGFLCVIILQYKQLLNRNLGYNPTHVFFTVKNWDESDMGISNFKRELLQLPVVESVGTSLSNITNGYSGSSVINNSGYELFTAQWNMVDTDYVPAMKIRLKEGRNFLVSGEILVNEKLVSLMNWNDGVLGKQLKGKSFEYGTIVGVMEDFPIHSAYTEVKPVIYQGVEEMNSGVVTLRLVDSKPQTVGKVNKKIAEIYPQEDMRLTSLKKVLEKQYDSVRKFRNSVFAATLSVLLITLMGLLGYVNDEIRRRSKEIAIRKINGATSWDILHLIITHIASYAIPAVLVGVGLSYYLGQQWLGQFEEKIELNIALFCLIGLGTLLLLVISVVWKSTVFR